MALGDDARQDLSHMADLKLADDVALRDAQGAEALQFAPVDAGDVSIPIGRLFRVGQLGTRGTDSVWLRVNPQDLIPGDEAAELSDASGKSGHTNSR